MNILTGRIAQILFALPMIFFGVSHFMNASGMAGMVPLPGGIVWVYVTGACLIAGALAIISGQLVSLSAFLLGVMIFIFAFSLHMVGFIRAADEHMKMVEMIAFLKDISIAAGAWVISGSSKK
ncbi:MAG: DoxX family protein [Spirochaetia bacterium]|nr:DoxX family protein [Spirochaetia bacterium]